MLHRVQLIQIVAATLHIRRVWREGKHIMTNIIAIAINRHRWVICTHKYSLVSTSHSTKAQITVISFYLQVYSHVRAMRETFVMWQPTTEALPATSAPVGIPAKRLTPAIPQP